MTTQGYWTEGKVVNGTNVGGGVYIPAGPSTPSGSVPTSNAGGGSLANNPALQYGAAGRSEWADTPGVDGRTMTDSIALGVPMSEAGNFLSEKNYVIPAGKYSGQSASNAMQYSAMEQAQIQTVNDRLAKEEAAKAVIKEKQKAQMSPLASYSFSPDTIAGVKNAIKTFQLTLDSTKNDPWMSAQSKTDKGSTILEATASQLGKMFATPDEFNAAYQQNPDIQKNINAYVQAGGDVQNVISKIPQPQYPTQNTQNTTIPQGNNNMSTMDYIGAINNVDNSAPSQQAEKNLFVEGELAKSRLAQIARIPQNLMTTYFGDDRTMGLVQQTRMQKTEEVNMINRQLDSGKVEVRQRAQLEMDKTRSELASAEATVEENNINAKNYMTGMLAKLGALNTSGEAPVALVNIDQKYQRQKQDLRSKADFAIRSIEIEMNNKINTLQDNADEKIIKIKNDLSKDEKDVAKEIMKAEQQADSDIYNIVTSYASKLRTKTDEYQKEAKKASEDYQSERYYVLTDNGSYKPATQSDILFGKAKKTNTSGQFAAADTLPTDVRNAILDNIVMNKATLSQLYTAFPQVAKEAINVLFNRFHSEEANPTKVKAASNPYE